MARWTLWLSLVITLVIAAGAQPDLRSMLALSIAALAVALVGAMLVMPAPSGRVIAVGVRRETPIAPRHCDPDAAGRPRPRAPSAV
jgi:hypothetical protein